MIETRHGKAWALAALANRRADRTPPVDNSALPAGAPMYFPCVSCGTAVGHPENFLTRRHLCVECEALKACGWLE